MAARVPIPSDAGQQIPRRLENKLCRDDNGKQNLKIREESRPFGFAQGKLDASATLGANQEKSRLEAGVTFGAEQMRLR
jgi:hypothetical protein